MSEIKSVFKRRDNPICCRLNMERFLDIEGKVYTF